MPQMGHDTKTDRLTDCQSQCDFDFDTYGSSSSDKADCEEDYKKSEAAASEEGIEERLNSRQKKVYFC
jgi:hypothetical protein